MTQLEWDRIEDRQYQLGIDRGVLYPAGAPAVAWNGLVSVSENTGRDVKSWYQDGVKFFEHAVAKPYSGKIQAYTYPSVLDTLLGGQMVNGVLVHEQLMGQFGLCYRTLVGGQLEGTGLAYKLHILYNLTGTLDDPTYTTLGGQVAPNTFGWGVSGIPVAIDGMQPSCHLSVDSRSVSFAKLEQIEGMLYGTESANAYLPSPSELLS